ncbi:terpenoid cyclases/Protein prenyltransferase [Artomyces pyxidatus]|uniref:Terpenoid cyclases/Protein prenyltransferase n=1 Tax=Artomyces pyxidatus TaxID=48021 RepID=A0ACB8SHV7_9AGAM|nr:terpenoid cyclases/Protein prenyltransferase [Artomyces pyxidatus]
MSLHSIPRPSPIDGYPTKTSHLQAETEEILQSHLPKAGAPPVLNKNAHLQFLVRNLVQGFPARYMSQDASQPWLMFWTLQSFSALQVGIDPNNKQRAIDTIMAWQHQDGGFGGGPGQAAHLLATYASVCSLAIVGRPGPGGGWDQIDREKLYKFYMSLKQPDGSFIVSTHGEVDVRGIYCLLVVAYLLNIITPELIAGTASFIASCQTYEGGFSSASHPYFSAQPDEDAPPLCLPFPRPSLGEAHGGYTFCGLASWVLLKPFLSETEPKPSIDEKRLLRWLVYTQGNEAELGGFKGRTNKLVDGCYSWWNGGEFALLEAVGISSYNHPSEHERHVDSTDENWADADDSLFNRKALQEYILLAGQHGTGGLRDKPPKNADSYHTLYCLAGLSAAQHRVFPSLPRKSQLTTSWKPTGETNEDLHKIAFTEALCWLEEEGGSKIVGPASNRVNATHPLFNLTATHTEGIIAHFYQQTVPKWTPFTAPAPNQAT